MSRIVVKKSRVKRGDCKTDKELKAKRREELLPSGAGSKRRLREYLITGKITKRG